MSIEVAKEPPHGLQARASESWSIAVVPTWCNSRACSCTRPASSRADAGSRDHPWAPQLRRPAMFASARQVRLWSMLEAYPGVTNYCWRPALTVESLTEQIADFWIIRDGAEQWLVIDDNVEQAGAHGLQVADQTTRSVPCVETISSNDIEHFSRINPVLVRTAIIAGLHGGQLTSPDLTTLALSPHRRGKQISSRGNK
jgi:hypothetical protein